MADVARRARVSSATVSNVLSGRKVVASALAERVHKAAADLDYQIDRAASLLRGKRGKVFGIVVPTLENPFFTALIASVERAAQDDGYDILVASTADDDATERARISALLAWRPIGVMVVPTSDEFSSRTLLETSGTPYVVLDRVATGIRGDVVQCDNEGGGRLAAQHLIAQGHEDILVVGSTLSLANIRARCDGIRKACQAGGVRRPTILEVGITFEDVAERLKAWLAAPRRPTAIVALTNFATMGVMSVLSQLSLLVPDRISLVGFDDYTWMAVSNPSITAIRQPIEIMGRSAWDCLRSRIDGAKTPPNRIVLPCRLEVRQSTRRPMEVSVS
jgi:DNA-binding LacI/PurR family transcriptional regulator